MERSPAAAEAVRIPPSCLAFFSCIPRPLEREGMADTVDFALKCHTCAADTFQILAFPLVAPDPSPYSGIEAGQTFFRPPHRLRCTTCGTEGPLFDVRTQGYDGVLNGGCTYESGDKDESSIPGDFRIVVSVFYNIEIEELKEIAREAGVNVSDLFDAIAIFGSKVGIGDDIELSYECA